MSCLATVCKKGQARGVHGLSEQPELEGDERDDSYESSDYEFLAIIAVEPSIIIIIMCIFIYRTYHLSSHGGLQFLLKGNQINIIQITNLQLSFYKSDQIKSNVGFW